MKIIAAILRRLGFDLFIRRPDHHYVHNFYGPASGKSIDIREIPEFSGLAKKVIGDGRTLLFYDRLYSIYQALSRVLCLPGVGKFSVAEVGVYKGGGSYFIASLLFARNARVRLFSFDTFEGHASADIKTQDPHQFASVFNDTSYEGVSNYLSDFSDVEVVKGRIQDTSHLVDQEKFGFVHLDTDLYEPMVYSLKFFGDKLIHGGVIIVDDYGFTTCPGVKQAVDEFMSDNFQYAGFHLLTGQYLIVRIGA